MQVTTRIIDGCKRRNSYYIANPQTDFYFVDNRFFTKSHPPKIAGFLLLLKAICLNNTNSILLWNIGQIADAVGMNRNTVSALIKESNGLGLIKALPNGYEITDDCFINPPQKDTAHAVYNEICRFCMTKERIRHNEMNGQWIGFLLNTTLRICRPIIRCRLLMPLMNGARWFPNPCRWLISLKCYAPKTR